MTTQASVGNILNSEAMKKKMAQVMGNEKMAAGFISSVISVTSQNKLLSNADPMTVIGAAMVAATLQLPIVPTLGLAYIVPYKGQAQFQIGYKGLIELAERSGQFKTIIDEAVYEGQLVRRNRFTGEYVFDEDAKTSGTVIGYMARFDLVNGFSKTIYWSKEEIEAHAKRFSQAYTSGYFSPWKSDFDAMARKTVLKALFSKYAPKSIQMQNAIACDQALVRADTFTAGNDGLVDAATSGLMYDDNPVYVEAEEAKKIEAEEVVKVKTPASKAKAAMNNEGKLPM
ncbi:MAG: recombinase RecT [Bacteroidales bacterium]|nr:recombinase RecT [Bacteroidales bacterium]MCM1206762.1 recombinase RecT [Bacillota bacterium]MCM1510662.1 recombinase RecT [Clostridium sp.]